MLSCVYFIKNTLNNKVYIGSSKNFYRRMTQHKNHLKTKKHRSVHLQRAWNKYGSDFFIFKILEKVSIKNLIQREQYWLDTYKSYIGKFGYNIRSVADRNTNLPAWNRNSWKTKVSEKDLVNYYLDGNTIKECKERFSISIDSVSLILKKNSVQRTKKESRKIRDLIHPEYAKQIGKINKGKLLGNNHPNFGKPGYWKGKILSKISRKMATVTRRSKYGFYFSKNGYKNLHLFSKSK